MTGPSSCRWLVFVGASALAMGCSSGTDNADAGGLRPDIGVFQPDAAVFDAGHAAVDAGGSSFPVLGDRSRIEQVSKDTVQAGGHTWNRTFFRNLAYRCGRTGHFTFLVMERSDTARQTRPLWVVLHGGNVGYYDAQGDYHGPESFNDEESAELLTGHAADGVQGDAFADNALGRRLADGYRVLVPSMCDHDLYAGTGQPYPDNPNWVDGDKVEGLLATTAALHFTVTHRAGDGAVEWPTSLVFLHGSSAGSAGAWHVGSALMRIGVRINGALLDSYLITRRARELVASRCSPVNASDAAFEMTSLEQKIGPFITDEQLFLENQLPPPFPLFDLVGDQDHFCCGQLPAIPPASQAGFTNNCRWVRAAVVEGMAGLGSTVQSYVASGYGHVIADEPGPHQPLVETWVQAILATQPPAPTFPP